MATPMLSFEDSERLRVEIEGRIYELSNADDLSLEQQGALNPCWKSVFEYLGALERGLTPEIIGDTKFALDRGVRALLRDCPDEVIDRLSDTRRLRLVSHFLDNSGLLEAAMQRIQETKKPPTGASSSRSSRPRTAARKKAG